MANRLDPNSEEGRRQAVIDRLNAPSIQAVPVSNRPAKVAADVVRGVDNFASKPFGFDNPVGKGLSSLAGLPAVAKTLENLAYGMPNTRGSGQARQLRPEAKEAASMALPVAPAAGKAAVQGAKVAARELGPNAGNMAQRYMENTGGVLNAVKNDAGPLQEVLQQRQAYPQADALDTAQRNAVKMLGLPEGNTPMERAKALGFDTEAYHATSQNFDAFKPGGNDPSLSGQAIWVSPYADKQPAAHNVGGHKGQFKEGANVMPLMVKTERPLVIDDKSMLDWSREVFADGSKEFPQLMPKAWADSVTQGDEYRSIQFDGEKLGWGDKTNETVLFNPAHIRSRFAAFDPARVNDNDLLGAADPRLLRFIAGGTAAGLAGAKAVEGFANGGLIDDPQIRQTPVANRPAKLAADGVRAINDFASKPFGFDNPVGKGIASLAGLPAIAQTLENTAYGMPNTRGTGQARQLRPEAAEAASMLLPGSPAAAKIARQGVSQAADTLGDVARTAMDNAAMVPAVRGPLAKQDGAIRLPFDGNPRTSAEKSALTKYLKSLENPTVNRRENMRGDGETIMRLDDIGQRRVVSPEDWVGKTLVPVVGDTTLTGGTLSRVRGVPLAHDVKVQGGPDFPLQQKTLGGDAGWASMLTAASAKQGNIVRAAQDTGRDVLGVYSAMSPSSINFSVPTAEAMLAQLPALKLPKDSIFQVNQAIQKLRPDFVGVDSPDVFNQIKAQQGFPSKGAGDLRKAIIEIMGKKQFADMGFPVYEDVAQAVTSPNLTGLNVGDSGYAAFKADPSRKLEPFIGHESYDTKIPGQYAGGLEGHIPAPIMFPKTFDSLRNSVDKNGKPLTPDMQLGSLRAKHLWEVADQQWLDGVMGYLGK